MTGKGKQMNLSAFFQRAPSAPPPASSSASASASSPAVLSPPPRVKPLMTSTPTTSSARAPPVHSPPSTHSLSSPLSSAQPLTPSSLSDLGLTALTPPSPSADTGATSGGRKRRQVNYAEAAEDDDEDEEAVLGAPAKRGRRIADDDDGDEDYAPDAQDADAADEDMEGDEVMEVDDEKEEKSAPPRRRPAASAPSPAASRVQPRALSFPPPSAASMSAKDMAALLRADLTIDPDAATTKKASDVTSSKEWNDSFLRPDGLRDAQGRRPGEAGYDQSSLFVPKHIYAAMTPAQQQYFDIKCKHFDLLLFYKIGKFYELYDLDAEVAVRELGLTYMVNQSRPHAGFPEAAFDKYSALAISLGYKIGRVEQTQTPKELDAANKQRGGKKTKIVERTLCSVLTPGTLTDIDLIGSHKSASLFALREKELSPAEIDALSQAGTLTALGATAVAEYGVCWVDCSIGAFTIGQFYDVAPRSQLATLLATVGPREVLIPKGGISDATRAIFRNELTPQCYKGLYEQPEPERFWTAEETYDWLSRQPYFRLFRLQPGGDEIPLEEAEEDWPPVLIQLTEARKDLAFSALGGLLWMLVWTKQAQQLLTRKDFTLYAPSAGGLHARSLILDNQTLINLEVMRDSEGGDRGSLLSYVDRCVSAMGHRLMKRWVSCPLGEVTAINDRLNAVQLLRDDDALRSACRQLLKELPDLERLMSSLHAYSLKKEKTEVMYGQQEQRKLAQMLQVLDGLDRAAEVRDRVFARVSRDSLNSVELAHCTLQFPNYADIVSEFRNVTDDWTQAVKQDGFITPRAGVVPAYDEACTAEQAAVEQLEAYLEEQREELRLRDLKYVHPNRDRYLLEVPVSRKVSSDYTVVSGTAKIKRYTTRALKEELLPALEQAELDKEKIGKDVTRMIYGKLASYNATWKRTVSALATLDCLCALAVVSADQNAQGVTCRPTFVPFDEGKGAQLELRQAIHPVLAANMPPGKGSTFIPNDTVLGCAECPAPIVLLSGPNMGGKSTLLRQACIAVILAQLGCFVPAVEARLTPVDRIFTRCGAADRLMSGQSTFLVEMAETATILHNASRRSLVILDELGRGTSTFDGASIAWAVVEHLRQHTRCLTLFSTHYHMLLAEYAGMEAEVDAYHMRCMAAAQADGADARQTVDFLYQYARGISPKSYGMNVALTAGVPRSVVEHATEISEEFERRLTLGEQRLHTAVEQKTRGQLSREEARRILIAATDRRRTR